MTQDLKISAVTPTGAGYTEAPTLYNDTRNGCPSYTADTQPGWVRESKTIDDMHFNN